MRAAIVLALIALCTTLVFMYPHRMVEPGELSEAHQQTGNDCFSCHKPFGGLPNDRCIACHTLADIGRDTVAHAERPLFHEALEAMECVSCHGEHNGRSADLAPAGFVHDLLSAAIAANCVACHAKPADDLHAPLPNTCSSCHDAQQWKPAREFDHALLPIERRNDCASCHQEPSDAMHERIAANCTSCHTTDGWKPAHFDHTKLTQAEQNTCAGCHQAPSDAFHQSTKDNCASCHGTNAWSPSTFDHSAYFRLEGDHNAKCATCHQANNYDTYTCYGCHEHTRGNIMGEHQEEGITNIADCVRCHRSGDEDDAREGGEGGRENKRDEKGEHDD
ncbi:MAG: cytochrome c3 family protein [Flavobacteriales bacterium]|nr:cytochrome c3 family protein [Flavobacteriales bacterium]